MQTLADSGMCVPVTACSCRLYNFVLLPCNSLLSWCLLLVAFGQHGFRKGSESMATIHNPTNFEPSDYEVVDYLDNKRPAYFGSGPVEEFRLVIEQWQREMAAVLGADWVKKIHHCIHCGNGNVRWITAVRHLPTGDVVVFGSDCTERLGFANKMAFKLAQLKAKAEAGHARMKIWKARERFLEANPTIAAAIEQAKQPVHANNHFVKDVLSKLNLYGSLSPRQAECVLSSLQRDLDAVTRKAAEALEVKGEGPVGRVTVTGTVLTVKLQASDFGDTLKMLLKLENNAKVWLTVPSGSNVKRNDVVTVKATFEQSKDDKSFSFGKRPIMVNVQEAA